MLPRDLVLVSAGKVVLSIGEIVGGYSYEQGSPFPHHRPVRWLSLEAWNLPTKNSAFEGKQTSVYQMTQPGNLIEAERRILDAISSVKTWPGSTVVVPKPGPSATSLPPLAGPPGRIQAILERKGQAILYGPPGTGKTYWAERTACELAARARFNKPFEDLHSEEKAIIRGNSHSPSGNVRLCCFHPSYGYEDFLEGLRPTTQNGVMHFAPRDGIFKQLCQDAQVAPQENFYLIIDEINRGDLPRIFGELLTILERDKRDKSILLPLTNQSFQIPANVYLIGTMNTADRSIALLDAALRRRFGFVELMPDSTCLGNTLVGGREGIPLGLWLDELNRRITTFVGQDARNLQIGHAYFLEKGQPVSDFSTFARILQDDIVPLLEEYCYADYRKLEQILGKDLVAVSAQQIRYELFDPAQQANLTQALVAMNPDMMTSWRASVAEKEAMEVEAEMEEQGEPGDEDESL
jgi:5-methylcytosine-specific restriction protein B